MMRSIKSRLLSFSLYLASTTVGALALLYPFIVPALVPSTPLGKVRTAEMPIMLTVLLGLCLLVLLYEVQQGAADIKFVALLGVLVAINAALRFIEVAIPAPGGFSPIFFLIVMSGYVFGGRFGFLMGALTLLVSALVTGGVGPWLPGQMFTAGWVGMSAPLCRPLVGLLSPLSERAATHARRPSPLSRRGLTIELIVLALFGALWGLAFGVVMNLWSWPFIAGSGDQFWAPGISLAETARRYLAYYLVTSLIWDVIRAVGNTLLILALAAPALRALRRFQRRFSFQYQPAPVGETSTYPADFRPRLTPAGQQPVTNE